MQTETLVITGASSGVGAATARLLARPGRRLVLLARRVEVLEAIARERGAEAEAVACDVADADAVERAFGRAGPGLHGLVNAAALPAGTVGHANHYQIAPVSAVNLVDTLLCVRAAASRMARGATIVNVGSLRVGTAAPASTWRPNRAWPGSPTRPTRSPNPTELGDDQSGGHAVEPPTSIPVCGFSCPSLTS